MAEKLDRAAHERGLWDGTLCRGKRGRLGNKTILGGYGIPKMWNFILLGRKDSLEKRGKVVITGEDVDLGGGYLRLVQRTHSTGR